MLRALLITSLVVAKGGVPVKVPEVSTAADVRQLMGGPVTAAGQLERIAITKGPKTFFGTALVLDDGTALYLTYGLPPPGWEGLVGERLKVKALLMPSIDDQSQSLMAPHLRAPETPVKAPRPLPSLTGRRVRLSGIAREAKGGAVILVDAQPLYLQGVDGWPAGVNGKRVIAVGTVVTRQHLPEAKRDAKGAVSQGAVGTQYVLEAPTWVPAEPPAPPPEPTTPAPAGKRK